MAKRSSEEMVATEMKIQNTADMVATLVAKKRQSKKGALGLPKVLDERRLKYAIPDAAFDAQCVFDRIVLWQIPTFDGDTYNKDSKIIRAATTQKRDRNECPRGIIVSAGLGAMDTLMSNGTQVGDIVRFVRATPWKETFDYVDGHPLELLILRDGDIVRNEDLMERLRAGKVKQVLRKGEGGRMEHVFVDNKGNPWVPVNPWISEDY